MGYINKKDTNGVKTILLEGELGYDSYDAGGDAGRIYVGTGVENIAIAKKSEVDALELLKAPLASPALTGTPLAPTATIGTSTTQIATTAFVQAAVSSTSASPITTPTITSPTTGAIDFTGTVTKSAFATSTSYAGALDYANWQLSYTADFAIIQQESTVGNLTTWTPSVGAALQLCYIRVKDGSDGHRSGWSPTVSFTTPDIYVETPTLTVTGEPSDVPETPTLTTSAFSVNGGTDTHASTSWYVKNGVGTVIWSSVADTANKLSITVPAGILSVSTAYTFEAFHTGTTYGNSGIVVNTATTLSVFAYDNYLAVAHDVSLFVTIYGNDVDTSTKLTNPATLPASTGRGVAFSADGVYMAVAHNITPYITIYKRSVDTFTKLTNPATLPTDTGVGVAFSADGVYMAVAHGTSPYITIYKRSGDTFTKLTNPATLPTGTGLGVAYYPRAFEGVL